MDVSIIAPVFNEENNIQPFFNEIENVIIGQDRTFEIVAVDDGSTDTTSEKLEKEVRKREYLKAVRLSYNYGQSIALQAGIDNSIGAKVVTIDSDLQNDPCDIPVMLDELEESDRKVLTGSRNQRKDPLEKKIASLIASKMRSRLFENSSTDYGCTLKAFEREAAESLELHDGMHRYIPVLLEKEGLKVSEIEVNHRQRYSGQSKYGFWRLPKGFFDMIDLWFDKEHGVSLRSRRDGKPDYKVEEVLE